MKVLKNIRVFNDVLTESQQVPPFFLLFTTKTYLSISFGFSCLQVMNIMLSSKPLVCTDWFGKYPLFVTNILSNLFFLVEGASLLYLRVKNFKKDSSPDPRKRLLFRLPFNSVECVITLGECLTTIHYFWLCQTESILSILSYFVFCFGYVKIIRRVSEFRTSLRSLLKSIWFFTKDMPFLVVLIAVYACFAYSRFSTQIRVCVSPDSIFGLDSPGIHYPAQCQETELSEKREIPFFINYENYGQAVVTALMMVYRSMWSQIISLGISGNNSITFLHQFLHITLVVIFSTFINYCFRGLSVALCYVSMDRLGIEKSSELTKPQLEYIQTEEHLTGTKLLLQVAKPLHPISRFCFYLRTNLYWRIIYNTVVIAGFLINLVR